MKFLSLVLASVHVVINFCVVQLSVKQERFDVVFIFVIVYQFSRRPRDVTDEGSGVGKRVAIASNLYID